MCVEWGGGETFRRTGEAVHATRQPESEITQRHTHAHSGGLRVCASRSCTNNKTNTRARAHKTLPPTVRSIFYLRTLCIAPEFLCVASRNYKLHTKTTKKQHYRPKRRHHGKHAIREQTKPTTLNQDVGFAQAAKQCNATNKGVWTWHSGGGGGRLTQQKNQTKQREKIYHNEGRILNVSATCASVPH